MKRFLSLVFIAFVFSACGGSATDDGGGPDLSESDKAAFDDIVSLMSDAESKYNGFLGSGRKEADARLDLVEWLKKRPNVTDAGVSDDGYTVWFNDTSGINNNIITYSNPHKGALVPKSFISLDNFVRHDNTVRHSKSVVSTAPGAQWLYMYVPFFWEQTKACEDEGFTSDVCSSVDDFPFVDFSGIRDLSKYHVDPMGGILSYVLSYINKDAGIDAMAAILTMGLTSDEGHIFIHTHGGVSSRSGKKFGFFVTSEELSMDNFAGRIEDLKSGKLSVARYGGKNYYALTPVFVSEMLGQMRSTFSVEPHFHVYAAACKSYDQAMIEAFMDNGADSYFGYTGLASHQFVYDSTMSFYSALAEGKTVKEAWGLVSPRFDSQNPFTTMAVTASSEKERYFYRMFLEFGGDRFETPPAQRLTAAADIDGGFKISGILTMPPEDGLKSGEPVGTISISVPSLVEGEYDIETLPGAAVSIVENSSGRQWIANKECKDENPLCLCSGKISIDYSDDFKGGVVEGSVNATLVNKGDVTDTVELSGKFTAVR